MACFRTLVILQNLQLPWQPITLFFFFKGFRFCNFSSSLTKGYKTCNKTGWTQDLVKCISLLCSHGIRPKHDHNVSSQLAAERPLKFLSKGIYCKMDPWTPREPRKYRVKARISIQTSLKLIWMLLLFHFFSWKSKLQAQLNPLIILY